MAHVAVIGAGFAGLATSLLLARRGHAVTLLEKDEADPPDDAEACFEDWTRRGVAQARQPHLLLARAAHILQDEFPALLDAAVASGANLLTNAGLRVGADERETPFYVCSRRLPLEAVFRREVAKTKGLEVLRGAEVEGFMPRQGETLRLAGLCLTDGHRMDADFVVDAAGRWSKTPEWLLAAGAEPPEETSQDCQFCYLTRWYRKKSGAAFPGGPVPARALSPFAPYICFPADNGVFAVCMALSMRDPLRGRLRDGDAFDRVAGVLAELAPWMEDAEPITEPQVMARIENRWRSLLRDGRPVASGLALLGDSALHTNPTLGRGIALALLQAIRLAETLDGDDVGAPQRVADFETWRAAELGVWYNTQVAVDAQRLEAIDRALAGDAPREPEGEPARFIAAVQTVAASDPAVAAVSLRLAHMLVTPQELGADPAVREAARRHLDAGRPLLPPMTGPTRAEFEALLA